MKREKSLLINSLLFFFGSLGKGVASIIIVFIGSFYILPDEMGIYDLVVSTISLVQPIIIFQINDGIYRWLLDKDNSKEDVIKCGFRVAYRNMIITNVLMVIGFMMFDFDHKILIAILLNLNCLYPIFQQITRGLKNHKIFAVSGIITGVSVLSISFIGMEFFDMGVEAFYIAQIVSNVAGMVYLGITQKISISPFNGNEKEIKKHSKPMQKYAIMLVPNSINQWMMKALDKFCILFYFTPYENGIYTVAHRFPDILIMLNNMFYSAWIEQSISEYDSDDRDEYFSKIYNIYTKIIISIVLLAIPVTKYIMRFTTGAKYADAYKYVPFLYIGVIFLGLSGFVGTGYLSTKKTEGILFTSLAGSFVNVATNMVFMPLFGLQIAGVAFVAGYLAMWIIRVISTRKFFKIDIQWGMFISLLGLTVVSALLVQLNNTLVDVIMMIVAIIITVIINRDILKVVCEKVANKVYKRNK